MGKTYRTFESYLRDNYYNEIYNALDSYIIRSRNSIDFKSYTVLTPSKIKLEDFIICSVCFNNLEDHYIFCQASVLADLTLKGMGTRDYDADSGSKWFTVSFVARLLEGLREFTITDVGEYSKPQFDKESTLSRFLVPYLYSEDLDKEAEKFLKKYDPETLEVPRPVDIREVIGNMCLSCYLAPLSENVFGKSYFSEADVEVYKEPFKDTEIKHIGPGTILVDPDDWLMGAFGEWDNYDNTVIHECVHQDRHALFFEMQKLLRGTVPGIESLCCQATVSNPEKDPLSQALRWIEWQACALTPRIQMPKVTATRKFLEIHEKKQQEFPGQRAAVIMEEAVDEFSKFFHVTRTCAKIRLCQMGFTQALGTFNYGIDEYKEPYSFNPEALKKGETFSLNERDYHFLFVTNPEFRQLVLDELFIYTENFFCIKDDQYVRVDERGIYHLTDYARDHVDECCLVFQAKTKYQAKEYDDSFFTECYLCREVDASLFVEEEFYDEGDNQDRIEKADQCQKIKKQAKAIADSADDLPDSFGKTLEYHMKRKCISPLELEELSGISEETILHYLDKTNDRPGKTSVLALCIGLNLQPVYSINLLRKAEYDLFAKLSEENTCYIDLIFNHPMETREQWNEKCKIWGIPVLPTRNR